MPPLPPTSSGTSSGSKMAAAPVCKTFAQNTWRKDLCSNCFKPKLEHSQCPAEPCESASANNQTQLYTPLERFQFKKWSLPIPQDTGSNGRRSSDAGPVQGILVVPDFNGGPRQADGPQEGKSRRRASVGFTDGSPMIIGYGGDDHHDDDHGQSASDDQDSGEGDSDAESLENGDLSDEEKEFKSLTAKNTEFNADTGNLVVELLEAPKPPVPPNGCSVSPQKVFRKADSRNLLRMKLQSPTSDQPKDGLDLVVEDHVTEQGDDSFQEDTNSECSGSEAADCSTESSECDPGPPQRPPPLPRTLPPNGPEDSGSKPSCHYAASDVKPQRSEPPDFSPPQPPVNTSSKAPSTTSPYSSTAILRGLPVRPPPAIKPKPKVPAKPSIVVTAKEMADEPKTSASPDGGSCYQEIQDEEEDKNSKTDCPENWDVDEANLSFQSRMSNLSQSLDLSRKSSKKKAPAPPPNPPQTSASPEGYKSPPGTPVKTERAKSLGHFNPEGSGSKKKFSLKKFLRLSKDGEENQQVDTVTSPTRRPRPEIIHPMDLARRDDEGPQVVTAEGEEPQAKTAPVRPPPPPRSKGNSQEVSGKPKRPPPPMAVKTSNGCHQTQHVGQSNDSEWRNKMPEESGGAGATGLYDDVRTRPPPRKPCRSGESERTSSPPSNNHLDKDLAAVYDTCDSDSHSDPARSKDTNSERYSTPQSSPGSERSRTSHEAPVREDPKLTAVGSPAYEENVSARVYEKVIVKNGNVEKVHWRLPSPTDNCNGALSDKSISSVSAVDSSYEEGPSSWCSSPSVWSRKKPVRLSLRKGKTVVHRNLEENYGAVINANHQALRQILDQVMAMQKQLQPGFVELKCSELRWQDFTLHEDSRITVSGLKSFHNATWKNSVEVTLMINVETTLEPTAAKGRMFLDPIVEFEDFLPCNLLPVSSLKQDPEDKSFFARVWVLEPMAVESLTSFSSPTRSPSPTYENRCDDDLVKSRCFLLLQLVHGLKQLQALGVEEVSGDPEDFLVIVSDALEGTPGRLVFLPEDSDGDRSVGPNLTLCQCALRTLRILLPEKPVDETCRLVVDAVGGALRAEKAASLSRAKLLLECLLWGPTELLLGATGDLTEQAFQRWLDLDRATALNSLIRNPNWWHAELNIGEELMLTFLVRTCAKILCEANTILSTMHNHVTE